MSGYTAVTEADRREMLKAIGVKSVQELFERQIPAATRLRQPLDLPAGQSEQEVYRALRVLAERNTSAHDEITFLGAGMYDHYVPAVIDALLSRSEFLTPYTPYQPEVSQGNLQVMFEYQTAISELTGLPVSNASVYDGASAVAFAGYLARLENGRGRFVVSRALHPQSREVLTTYARGFGAEVVEVPVNGGRTDVAAWRRAIDADTCAVFFQQPNFLGAVEDAEALARVATDHGAIVVGQYDPIPLGIVKSPAECGVDIAVGEGQSLGNRLDFGGPSFGFFAAASKHLRRMPGRIAGETRDIEGRRGFVLTLQTREQHIRREKATSNICTAQALNALAGMIYLAWLGRDGLVELAELLLQRTNYARDQLGAVAGITPLHTQPVVREFAVRLDAPVEKVIAACQANGINPGFALGNSFPEYKDGLLIALTEQRSKADIDLLVETIAAAVDDHRYPEARR
jgi:glycine dehydrogenase subunit 1